MTAQCSDHRFEPVHPSLEGPFRVALTHVLVQEVGSPVLTHRYGVEVCHACRSIRLRHGKMTVERAIPGASVWELAEPGGRASVEAQSGQWGGFDGALEQAQTVRGVVVTFMPDRAAVVRLEGEVTVEETRFGWRASMSIPPETELDAAHLLGGAALVAVGESHYGAQISDYDPGAHIIVLRGVGPRPE